MVGTLMGCVGGGSKLGQKKRRCQQDQPFHLPGMLVGKVGCHQSTQARADDRPAFFHSQYLMQLEHALFQGPAEIGGQYAGKKLAQQAGFDALTAAFQAMQEDQARGIPYP